MVHGRVCCTLEVNASKRECKHILSLKEPQVCNGLSYNSEMILTEVKAVTNDGKPMSASPFRHTMNLLCNIMCIVQHGVIVQQVCLIDLEWQSILSWQHPGC